MFRSIIFKRRSQARKGGALLLCYLFLFNMGMTCLGCKSQGQLKGVVYRSNEVQFELGARMPGARQIHSDDALVTWQNDVAGTTVAVNARCGLDGDDVPLEALIHHLLIQFTDREEVVRRPFILDDRAALRVDEMANLDGVRRYLSMIVLKKDGCVYDFIHIDGQLAFDGIAPEVETSRRNFLLMVEGFHTL